VTRPNPTKSDRASMYRLNLKQEQALELTLEGRSDAEIAETVGITRQTVNVWRNRHPGFVAEVNRRRRQLAAKREAQLDILLNELLDASLELIQARDPRAVLGLARLLLPQVLLPGRSVGFTEPEEVVRHSASTPLDGLLEDLNGPSPADLAKVEDDLLEALAAAEKSPR
jgi:hypothetical protein